jgi:hypothetical protein
MECVCDCLAKVKGVGLKTRHYKVRLGRLRGPWFGGMKRAAELEAAGDGEDFAGHVLGVGRGQVDSGRGDVVGLANAA